MDSLREMLEAKNFYRMRLFKSKHYPKQIPFRALSEYELWECEVQSYEELLSTGLFDNYRPGDKINARQAYELSKVMRESEVKIVFTALRDFIEGLTLEVVKKIRGLSALANAIREASGVHVSTEEVVNF